ncbi:alpha/beta fold hydrolase [Streptomyces sp. NPDC055808]
MSRQFTAGTRLRGVDTLGWDPPVLFVNGGLSTQRQWKRVITRLDGRYRTVTYDARGRGSSNTSTDHSLRGAVDDVDRVVEATALGQPILVGWSHGATIALCYAAQYPERVSGLVLIDGVHPVSVLDDMGRERVRRQRRGRGRSSRLPSVLAPGVSLGPQDRAELVIETDEVNGDLGIGWEALRCPTVLVVPASDTAGAAAVDAVASDDSVTFLVTTATDRARILTEDPDVVAAAIGEVRRRRMPDPDFLAPTAPLKLTSPSRSS